MLLRIGGGASQLLASDFRLRRPLIHVPLVPLLLAQIFYVFRRLFQRFSAFFLDNLVQSNIDVLRHAGSISADKEMRALFQPGKKLLAILQHPVLDINFVRLIPREGGIESGQDPRLSSCSKLGFVEKVAFGSLLAKKKPVLAGCSNRLAFL